MLNEILKDFKLKENQIEKLNKLRQVCLEYNKHTNLTTITEEKEFNIKHILDSLTVLKFHNLNNKKILDVGSGGGFPGLVLAIVLPDSHITMLDSNNKKTKYIDHAIKELNISNANTITSRVEEADVDEKYDVVLSRAVAPLNILLEITAFAANDDGELIYYKGSNLDKELPESWDYVEEELGISFYKNNLFKLDDKTNRRIISFKKIWITQDKYPRSYSQIKKSPLY